MRDLDLSATAQQPQRNVAGLELRSIRVAGGQAHRRIRHGTVRYEDNPDCMIGADIPQPVAASDHPDAAGDSCARPFVTMVAWMVAGIRTHYENTVSVLADDTSLRVRRLEVHPSGSTDLLDRLPVLPLRTRGTIRTYASMRHLFSSAAPDVVWTQILLPVAPFMCSVGALRQIPTVFDADVTPRLLEGFGDHYGPQTSGPPLKRHLVDAAFGAAARHCAAIVCWSEWVAQSFERDYGVSSDRLHVLPPGVDVSWWARPTRLPTEGDSPVRLLFVGGDFARKGGNLLLDVWRSRFAGRCELHLVTKADVAPEPGLHVYRDLTPNDERLRRLYHTSDALVLPTLADCYSLASIEAMASSLPVLTTAVGGIPDIVADGETGLLIRPGDGAALAAAMEALVSDAGRRRVMGDAGRAAAVARFDAMRNAAAVANLLRAVARAR